MTEPPKTKPKRRWLRILLGVGVVGVGGALLIAWGMLRTPGWYEPATMPADPAERQSIRNRLVNAEQSFTHELLNGQPFKYHIYEDYVNQWLAMRYDIYPRLDEIVVPLVRDPFVAIGDGRVLLAGKVTYSGREAVASVEFRPTFENGEIVLRLGTIRCGSIPLPNLIDTFDLNRQIRLDRGDAWPGSPVIEGSLVDGLRIGARGWWQNGGIDYEVTDVIVGDGVLTLYVSPLERQASSRRQ